MPIGKGRWMKNRLICANNFLFHSYRNKIFYFESYAELFNIPFIIKLIDSDPNLQFYKEKNGDSYSLCYLKEEGARIFVGYLKYDLAEMKSIEEINVGDLKYNLDEIETTEEIFKTKKV